MLIKRLPMIGLEVKLKAERAGPGKPDLSGLENAKVRALMTSFWGSKDHIVHGKRSDTLGEMKSKMGSCECGQERWRAGVELRHAENSFEAKLYLDQALGR